jgi:hypothetical protein
VRVNFPLTQALSRQGREDYPSHLDFELYLTFELWYLAFLQFLGFIIIQEYNLIIGKVAPQTAICYDATVEYIKSLFRCLKPSVIR